MAQLENGKDSNKNGDTQIKRIMEALRGVRFTQVAGHTYVRLPLQPFGPHRWFRLDSGVFEREVVRRALKLGIDPPSVSSMQRIRAGLEAQHATTDHVNPMPRTKATCEESVLDLGDSAGRVVRITNNGWTVERPTNPPLARRDEMAGLPEPMPPSNLQGLWKYVRVHADDRPLVVAWLACAFLTDGQVPLLTFTGPEGAAKSTASAFVCSLVDPGENERVGFPDGIRELLMWVQDHRVVVFDNLSRIRAEMSDVLCQVVTGGTMAARKLYSDSTQYRFKAQGSVILNGISLGVVAPDLLSRMLVLELSPVPETERMEDRALKAAWEREKPAILAGLLDVVSHCIKRRGDTSLPRARIRMTDYAAVLAAASEACGVPPAEAARRAEQLWKESNDRLMDDPYLDAIRNLMAARAYWKGTATELLGLLRRDHGLEEGSAHALGDKLRRLVATLARDGVKVQRTRGRKQRTIVLERTDVDLSDDSVTT